MNHDSKTLAKLFGRMGGLARKKKLTKKRRIEIARMGAVAKNKNRTATV
jgi:hypothetical protein